MCRAAFSTLLILSLVAAVHGAQPPFLRIINALTYADSVDIRIDEQIGEQTFTIDTIENLGYGERSDFFAVDIVDLYFIVTIGDKTVQKVESETPFNDPRYIRAGSTYMCILYWAQEELKNVTNEEFQSKTAVISCRPDLTPLFEDNRRQAIPFAWGLHAIVSTGYRDGTPLTLLVASKSPASQTDYQQQALLEYGVFTLNNGFVFDAQESSFVFFPTTGSTYDPSVTFYNLTDTFEYGSIYLMVLLGEMGNAEYPPQVKLFFDFSVLPDSSSASDASDGTPSDGDFADLFSDGAGSSLLRTNYFSTYVHPLLISACSLLFTC